MSYLLYLPGVTTGSNDAYARFGLYDLMKDGGPLCVNGPGPDGGHGLLCAWGTVEEPPELTWREGGQTWKQIGNYWLGKSDNKPVEPESISRSSQYRGHYVEMADGRKWLVPIAAQLPHKWGMNGKRTPKEPFEQFCATSEKVYSLLTQAATGEPTTFPDSEGWAYLCNALALNYHVNEHVVEFLEIIDDSSFIRALIATVERDLIREVEEQKKTDEQPIPVG